jgi:hypothetical protein
MQEGVSRMMSGLVMDIWKCSMHFINKDIEGRNQHYR